MLLENPYDCSLGLVIEHQDSPPAYIIRLPDGRVTGVLSSAELSPANVEAALANPAPVPVVPQEIPNWRLRVVAGIHGLKPAITAALASLEEPARTIATEVWFNGNTIRRDSPLVAAIAAALGLTGDQLDAYFIQAAAFPT